MSRWIVYIFSMVRRHDREKFFDWCCYLYEYGGAQPFALKNNPKFNDLNRAEDIKKATVVVWRADVSEFKIKELKKKKGIIPKSIDKVGSITQQIKMLLKKRVDIALFHEPLFRKTCKTEKLDCGNIKAPFTFKSDHSALYLALGKGTSPKAKSKFVNAFKEFSKTKKYKEILKK